MRIVHAHEVTRAWRSWLPFAASASVVTLAAAQCRVVFDDIIFSCCATGGTLNCPSNPGWTCTHDKILGSGGPCDLLFQRLVAPGERGWNDVTFQSFCTCQIQYKTCGGSYGQCPPNPNGPVWVVCEGPNMPSHPMNCRGAVN